MVLFPLAVIFGHAEDVLALALVLWAVAASLRGRPIAAALLLGAGIASKQWALLGLPLLIATTPRAWRGRALAASLALPLLLVGLTLGADWHHASRALLAPRAYVHVGQAALWIHTSKATVVGTPFRIGAFLVAGLVAWRLRGTVSPRRLLAGYALVFLGRILFEPVVFSYYLSPGLAFLLLHERVTEERVRRTFLAGTALLFFFTFDIWPWVWWVTAWAMLTVLGASAVVDVFGLRRGARASWPGSTSGSPRFLRRAASPERRDTTIPAPVRS
jgi:hypothetical protein